MTDETAFTSDEQLRAVTIGEPVVLAGPITLVEYDPQWPALYAREAQRIRDILEDRALQMEHIGSTSVPGLAAKPIIDILLVVSDPADEASYVPDLEAAGYVLRIREPDWHQHRLFKGPDTNINLHVYPPGSVEIERYLLMRDSLRSNPAERELYERTKRDLAQRTWKYVQHYADAKGEVIEAIIARARAADTESTD